MFKCFRELYEDAKNIASKDPACKNIFEVILLYPGFHALVFNATVIKFGEIIKHK